LNLDFEFNFGEVVIPERRTIQQRIAYQGTA